VLEEERIPIPASVQAATEMLGFDPLYVANEGILLAIEGILLAILPETYAGKALCVLRSRPEGWEAALIGYVESGPLPLFG
jgi:hydrogenase expression/formation protein HypE